MECNVISFQTTSFPPFLDLGASADAVLVTFVRLLVARALLCHPGVRKIDTLIKLLSLSKFALLVILSKLLGCLQLTILSGLSGLLSLSEL
jgi:hypothetical protein